MGSGPFLWVLTSPAWLILVVALSPPLIAQIYCSDWWGRAVRHDFGSWLLPITAVVTLAFGAVLTRFSVLPLWFCLSVFLLFVLVQAYGVARRKFEQERETARLLLVVSTAVRREAKDIAEQAAGRAEQAAGRAERATREAEQRILRVIAQRLPPPRDP